MSDSDEEWQAESDGSDRASSVQPSIASSPPPDRRRAGPSKAAKPRTEQPKATDTQVVQRKAYELHRRTNWSSFNLGPTFPVPLLKVASPPRWPEDGLPGQIAFRPAAAVSGVLLTPKEANLLVADKSHESMWLSYTMRKLAMLTTVEQMKESYQFGWWPGKVYDPRVEKALVLEADREAQERAAKGDSSSTPSKGLPDYSAPFQHPYLDAVQYEILDEESATEFLQRGAEMLRKDESKGKTREFSTSLSEQQANVQLDKRPETTDARPVGDETAGADPDAKEIDLSILTPVERFVATFEEVGPRNDIKQGGLKIFLGAPDPKEEILVPPLEDVCVPGTGRKAAKDTVHLINVGGTVYALAWRPVPNVLAYGPEYLMVSAADTVDVRTPLGETCPQGTPGTLQLWSVRPIQRLPQSSRKGKERETERPQPGAGDGNFGDSSVHLDAIFYHEYGPCWALEWCPSGHDYRSKGALGESGPVRRLGLLAGVFKDGSLRIFVVPHPDDVRARAPAMRKDDDTLRINLKASLTLDAGGAILSCLSWAGGERLAAGTSTGHVVVWATGDLLRAGVPIGRPSHFLPLDDAYITSIVWSFVPYQTGDGAFHPESPFLPHMLITTSVMGTQGYLDLNDPYMGLGPAAQQNRVPLNVVTWLPHIERFLLDTSDGSVRIMNHRITGYGASKRVGKAGARVLSMTTSAHHPFIAYGSADGCVRMLNVSRAVLGARKKGTPFPISTAYRLDHDRANGKVRMLENIMPEMVLIENDETTGKGRRNRFRPKLDDEPTAFHPGIAVRAVAWCPNTGRSHLLASGTGIGTVRIDRFEPGRAKMSEGSLTMEELQQRKDRSMTSPEDGESSPQPLTIDTWDAEERTVSFFKLEGQIIADARADGFREQLIHKPDIADPNSTEPQYKKIYPNNWTGAPPSQDPPVKRKQGRPRKPKPEGEEAQAASKKKLDKSRPEGEPKKQGRPRKPKPGGEEAQAASKKKLDESRPDGEPKKRGRPRKPQPEGEEAEAAPKKKRGRPGKENAADEVGVEKIPKKRGRPPKKKPGDGTASQEAEASNLSATPGPSSQPLGDAASPSVEANMLAPSPPLASTPVIGSSQTLEHRPVGAQVTGETRGPEMGGGGA